MVADELDPSVWLLVQVPAYEVEDARTVRTTIDQITDLDDRQVFWQTQCFAARTEETTAHRGAGQDAHPRLR
jgi:hypothetical protein